MTFAEYVEKHDRRARQRRIKDWCCGAPDCAERIMCPKIGGPGHFQCGVCPEHQIPRHVCGCTEIEPVHTKPASEESPEEGHTWRISAEGRTSSKVVADPEFTDAPDFDGSAAVFEVRGWSLSEGLRKAADLPFEVLTASLFGGEQE